ncbi:CD82 antigen isoform X2 [Antennarius striatus]|uniref:CD82 antigen isoform X2 n=1 Tax=Antennarius striatus TaxID=241820 RepID=UPI0035B27C94
MKLEVLGLSVGGCGIWILFDGRSLLTVLQSVDMRTVGAGLLFIGGAVLLVGVVGFLAAGGNRFLLLTYVGLLVVLVLGQLFVTLLLIINRDKVERTLDQTIDDIIVGYGGQGRPVLDRLMDNIQKQGRCCGRMGPSDWLKNSYIQSLNLTDPRVLPCSCFSSPSHDSSSVWCSDPPNNGTLPGSGNASHDQGCNQQLRDWLQENTLTIMGMGFGVVLIQVVQVVITIYLYRAFGKKAALKRTKSLTGSDHAHQDHAQQDHAHQDLAPEEDFAGNVFDAARTLA